VLQGTVYRLEEAGAFFEEDGRRAEVEEDGS
jgi:hypothetical protein